MPAEHDLTQHDLLSGPAQRQGTEIIKVLTDEAEFQLRVKGLAAQQDVDSPWPGAITLALVHQVNLLSELPATFGLKSVHTAGVNSDSWVNGARPYARRALELLEPVPGWPGLEPVGEDEDYLVVTGLTGDHTGRFACGERAQQWPPCQL
jgi:hypothetical protein